MDWWVRSIFSVEVRSVVRWVCRSRRWVARSLFVWMRVVRFVWRVLWEGWWVARAVIRDGSWRIVCKSVVLCCFR